MDRATSKGHPTSTPASINSTVGENVRRLAVALDVNQLSIRELLNIIGLKDRVNFVEYSLKPAIKGGFVTALYPDKPRHPRQKYLLTTKGRALLSIIKGNKSKGDI